MFKPMQPWLTQTGPWAPVLIRLSLGVVFMAHGLDKLTTLFGSGGFQSTVEMMQSLNLHPAQLMAGLSGGGEFLGGCLILIGLCTRFGAAMIAGTMLVAIIAVHWEGGLFARDNGFEYPLVALGAALSLILSGGGPLALDQRLKNIKGHRWDTLLHKRLTTR